MRGKKRFLAIFAGVGIISTALLVLLAQGLDPGIHFWHHWTNWFQWRKHPFMTPCFAHVAKEEDRDKVSTRGYAMGYRRYSPGSKHCHDPAIARHMGTPAFLLECSDLVGSILHPTFPKYSRTSSCDEPQETWRKNFCQFQTAGKPSRIFGAIKSF